MNDFNEKSAPTTRELVPEDQRVAVATSLFGVWLDLKLEPAIWQISERLARNYDQAAFFNWYILSNSGFYMAPDEEEVFEVSSENYCSGTFLSADALGIVSSLYAFSHFSHSGDWEFPKTCAQHFQLLLHYALRHREWVAIERALF